MSAIWTIGHSRSTPDEFLARLRADQIDAIVDVRSHPTSRWPWFNRETMQTMNAQVGIAYTWLPDLGGWSEHYSVDPEWAAARDLDIDAYAHGHFPKQRIAVRRPAAPFPIHVVGESPDLTTGWTNYGLHDYSLFTQQAEFWRGIHDLLFFAEHYGKVAIMCCEQQWWRCHRSMIADAMLATGWDDLVHSLTATDRHPHSGALRVTPRAIRHSAVVGDRLERYSAETRQVWDQHCWPGD